MIADGSGESTQNFFLSNNSEVDRLDDFPTLELALSGGGHRAAAYALGALLYLVHAKLNKRVRNIASVSGASITNAFVASRCDFQSVNIDDFRVIAAELISKVARRGLLSVWTTWLSVVAVIVVAVSASLASGMMWRSFTNSLPSFEAWGSLAFLTRIMHHAARFLHVCRARARQHSIVGSL
jgi:hypothetical protein